MPIDPERLKGWKFADVEHTYGADEVMLCALGVGTLRTRCRVRLRSD